MQSDFRRTSDSCFFIPSERNLFLRFRSDPMATLGFAVFSPTSTKRFTSGDLKISVTHSRHRWHEHFTAKECTNKMRKNVFCFDQIIDLKKAKKYTLQKSIIHIYTSNHHRIAVSFCDQRIQFIETLKRCDDCFYQK